MKPCSLKTACVEIGGFFNMFLKLRSPKGGMEMVGIEGGFPNPKESNILISRESKVRIVNDWYALKIGYAEKEIKVGDTVWMKPEDFIRLFKLLKKNINLLKKMNLIDKIFLID